MNNRSFVVPVAAALLFALVACGGSKATTATPSPMPSLAPATTPTPQPPRITRIEALNAIDAWFPIHYGGFRPLVVPAGTLARQAQDLKCPDIGLNGAGDIWLARCTYTLFSWIGTNTPLVEDVDLRVEVDAYSADVRELP